MFNLRCRDLSETEGRGRENWLYCLLLMNAEYTEEGQEQEQEKEEEEEEEEEEGNQRNSDGKVMQ